MQHPLRGISVVAVEQAVAAPPATRHLVDLGARVIKIERPGAGDFARDHDRTVYGQSSYFVWLNRGKESLELDIKDPADRAPLVALAGDRRFATNDDRVANNDELTSIIERAFVHLDAGQVLARFDGAGIANARLRSPAEFARHRQLVARQRWRPVATPGGIVDALRSEFGARWDRSA